MILLVTSANGIAQDIEGRVGSPLGSYGSSGRPQYEGDVIVVGESQPEIHVRAKLVSERLDRIARVVNLVEEIEELVEPLLNHTVEEVFLGFEVEIDRSRRTTDLLGQSAHRKAPVAFLDQGISGGAQDRTSYRFPVLRA